MTRPAAMQCPRSKQEIAQLVSIKRRSRVRFPGVGWVVNMSSGGVLVAHQHQINEDARVELNIEYRYGDVHRTSSHRAASQQTSTRSFAYR
jgi:hypothetical protein